MQVDVSTRELTIKLVYYGAALSGKTTNLRALYELLGLERSTRLMTLETRDDRTLFFDLLPLTIWEQEGGALALRLKVLTVPGQVIHNATRRLVLQGADGVAFVADSQVSAIRETAEAFMNLRDNLLELKMDLAAMPLVIQFNKRDLAMVRPDRELNDLALRSREPVYRAVATQAEGVAETFLGLLGTVVARLESAHDLAARLGRPHGDILAEVCARLGLEAGLERRARYGVS